jgi:hypothetical protein
MAFERHWKEIQPRLFTADGGADGKVTVENTCGFKVRQIIKISAVGQPDLRLEVKRVVSTTILYVGRIPTKKDPNRNRINLREDISNYTLANFAQISAAFQDRNHIPREDRERAVYEEEPTLAKRVIPVDCVGDFYNENNRFPVDVEGTFNADIESPNNQEIQNIPVVNANTEFSVNLPNGTKHYRIKVRRGYAIARLSFNAGETNTKYRQIDMGVTHESPNLDLPDNTKLYLQVNKAGVILEVMSYYKT